MRLRTVVMPSALLAVAVLVNPATPARGAETKTRQYAVVTFKEPVLVAGTFLMGRVSIVHDEERMAQGLPCTQIFQLEENKLPVERVAVHCKRVSRPVTSELKLAMRTTDPSYKILTGYQLPGTDHAHELSVR